VQTGPGLPDWAWNRYELSWAGPIEAAQRYRLIVLSPWPLALWRIASVVAVVAFLAILVGASFRLPPGLIRRGAGASAILLAALMLPNLGRAQTPSEFPSAELLEVLKARLTEPAPCHPQCAELTSAAVSIDEANLSVDLRMAAQDVVAVPLPSASRGWQPQSVSVDGVERRLLYRSRDGRRWLRVEPGVHDVALSGALAAVDSLTLDFSLIPHATDVSAPGWDSAGISEGRLVSGALELVRQRDAEAEGAELPATVFPPYVRVRRNISVDLDGQVRTVVQRVAPEGNAFTLEIDLLPNESVVTAGVEANEGRALVAFAANQQQLVWDSRLPLADSLSLTAPEDVPWTESWLFTVSHIWHAEYDGLPASPPGTRDEGFFMPEYYPRPGESLTVDLSRPSPASGDTIAIDAVEYERFAGDRSSESMLHFEYRSTQGGEHTITLPADSELGSVRIDGEIVPLELDDRQLEIQVTPGEHEVDVEWRDMLGASFATTLPAVDLGGGASNIYSSMTLPQDRWVLLSYGPTLGPAILYWPELVVFVLAALLLGRVALSPLKTHEWLLLGLGLSTFAWPVLFLFAVWAFIMSWRQRARLELERRWFNLMQVGLAILTVTALISLIGAIPTGLLGLPDMQISSPVRGNGSLNWFNDRSAGLTDRIGVVSVSLWFYKAAMLAWALWLSFALLRWLRWAWSVYTIDGLWRGKVATGDAS
jgi:hypothetical protein